jgi:hypothetical protein
MIRFSAKVKDITKEEYEEAINGINALIDSFEDLLNTLNEQDPATISVKSLYERIIESKNDIINSYDFMGETEIV